MKVETKKNNYKLQLAKRYAAKAFSPEELKNAELLLKHIDQFSSPQKELELVKYVLAHSNIEFSKAA